MIVYGFFLVYSAIGISMSESRHVIVMNRNNTNLLRDQYKKQFESEISYE